MTSQQWLSEEDGLVGKGGEGILGGSGACDALSWDMTCLGCICHSPHSKLLALLMPPLSRDSSEQVEGLGGNTVGAFLLSGSCWLSSSVCFEDLVLMYLRG